jgi:hypothetical protein
MAVLKAVSFHVFAFQFQLSLSSQIRFFSHLDLGKRYHNAPCARRETGDQVDLSLFLKTFKFRLKQDM